MALIKVPIPVASVVLKLATVGDAAVFQHTPRAVTAPPPSVVILPPEVADELVIAVTAVVVIEEGAAEVVNVTSFPYAVPVLLVA